MSDAIPEEALKAARDAGLVVLEWDAERRILTVGEVERPKVWLRVYPDGEAEEVMRILDVDPPEAEAPPKPVEHREPANRHERRKASALERRRS